MATRVPVDVELYISQVRDGSHYQGHLKFDTTKFDYEIRFLIPIPQLDEVEPSQEPDPEEIRRLFQLTLKKGEAGIELSLEEYAFFLEMIMEFAGEFYYDPKTRLVNSGLLSLVDLFGRRSVLVYRGVPPIGISATKRGPYDFSPELCELLNGPKFGCELTAEQGH